MKKIAYILSFIIMIMTLAACGSSQREIEITEMTYIEENVNTETFTNTTSFTSEIPEEILTETSFIEKISQAKQEEMSETTVIESLIVSSENTLNEIEEQSASKALPLIENVCFDKTKLEDCVFIGDSICSGLKLYNNLLSDDEVMAKGCVASWSIYDYTFTYMGQDLSITDIISQAQPKNIIIWMGMNDINMISKEQYIENMKVLVNNCLLVSPDSNISFISISPTTIDHKWQANNRISDYNIALEEYCTDNEYYFMNSWSRIGPNGYLETEYSGGDGLHLSREAYVQLFSFDS